MAIYDVSVPLSADLPTYPGDPGIRISNWLSLEKNDAANVSLLHFGAHTGTHIDAPAHFIQGAKKIESLDLEVLIGPTLVVQVPSDMHQIDEEFVGQNCLNGPERILFKTRNSAFWGEHANEFRQDYTFLSTSAAVRLVENGVKLVGIDYLSIEEFGNKNHQTHLALLSRGVVIVEGLSLEQVQPGSYELICLPLRIRDGHGDGAPARVVLRTID